MKSHPRSGSHPRLTLISLLVAPAALLLACGDTIQNDYHYYYGDGGADEGGESSNPGKAGSGGSRAGSGGSAGEAGEPTVEPEAGTGGMVDQFPVDPNYPDAPQADTQVKDLTLDLFGVVGNRYWFGVQQSQVDAMNNGDQGGGGCPFCGGDPYFPGGSGSANFVDHLWITSAGDDPHTADFGKVQVKVVGQSSRRLWTPSTIPNLNIDADQFVKDQRVAGYEHLRFNNGQVGSIFRERLTTELYRLLGYQAPLSNYAWVSSNVWGPDVAIPYILVERYKQAFCRRYETEFGGGCVNMWEFVGDFNGGFGGGPKGPFPEPGPGGEYSLFDDPNNCQLDTCESSRVKELEAKLRTVPRGEGFKVALEEYIDWPAYHRFQCLSYVLGTGDDALHNTNNVVLVERMDGKFQYLPYSVDISLGQDWYPYTPLTGTNLLSIGCQQDKVCWADTIAVCEDVIADFENLEPNKLLKKIYDDLDTNGMLRGGDQGRYEFLDAWFTDRIAKLPDELETFRNPPVYCEWPYMDCNGVCKTYEECYNTCLPPKDDPGMAGAGPMPVILGEGGAGNGVGGTMGVGGDIVAGGMAGVGGGPVECPPMNEYPMMP
jgi:hypothetical protein